MQQRKYSAIAVVLLTLLCLGKQAHTQITLTGNDYLSSPSVTITDKIKIEGVFSPSGLSSVPANDKIRTYQYVDGFGRPLQEVQEGVTPNGKDIINFFKYDEFGRSTKQYLPFEYTSVTSGSPYQDRPTAISNQTSFYSTNTTANKIAADSKPYIQSEVEQSPMQRLLKQGNAGDGFQTDQHFKAMTYRVNDGSDNVRKWDPDGTSSGTYSANELSVTEGADENGVKTIVFSDKLGRLVLKRRQADETIGGTNYPYFDTYYVYDLLGNVSCIIPPKAVVKLASAGWNIANAPNLIYTYKYDSKNRVTEKKTPGATVMYIVYDPLDRVVLMQTGNLRNNNKWLYSKYDASGRVVIEGVYTDNTHTNLSGMQAYVDGLSCYGSASTTYYEENTTATSSFYTNNCFPTTGTEERLYNYYDSYDYYTGSYGAVGLPGEQSAVDKVLGMPTATVSKVLGTSTWNSEKIFYDKRYNIIQVQSVSNIQVSGITTIVTDFGGRVTEKQDYIRPTKTTTVTIRNSYTYDKVNRLKEVKQGHDGGTMIIVARYEYNPLGQLVDKKLHSTNSGSSFLQSVDFRYNTRGQLTSINNSSLSNDGGVTNDETNDVWGMNFLYEQTDAAIGNTANWTGLLSAVKWKATVSGGNNDQRAYLYNYDKLYRLTSANYKAYYSGGGTWTKDVNGFNEAITYDWNGNILTMKRNAVISGSVTGIDDMTYDYGTGTDNDRLLNMAETSSNSYGYRNFTGSTSGYTYDDNGNLTADAKKGITITYNELDKPVTITQTATGKYVQFEYSSLGARMSKKVYNGSTTTTEYYIGAITMDQNKVVKYFDMVEGRVRKNSTVYTFEYFISDHLNNVRVSFEDNGSGTAVVRQENSYYAYGMMMAGNYIPTDPNKKLYNAGSEWEDDFGGIIDYFSTFFRMYDPIIGRFNSVDPKAEITVELSVYHYSGNNPVNFNDPMGDAVDKFSGSHVEYIIDRLLSSIHGGSWSSATGITAFFGDENTAKIFGVAAILGMPFHLDENFELSYLEERILANAQSYFFGGNKDFSWINIGKNLTQVIADLSKISTNLVGAFLIAALKEYARPHALSVSAIPGIQKSAEYGFGEGSLTNPSTLAFNGEIIIQYDPAINFKIDGVTTPSFIALGHELWHALDFYSTLNREGNVLWPWDPSDPNYNSTLLYPNPQYSYMEFRAVFFENMLRFSFGMGIDLRLKYGGVDIYKNLLSLKTTNWLGFVKKKNGK